jgi:hypothetical protein
MIKDIISMQLFGNEAGEDEDLEILNSYFVEKPDFNLFYAPDCKLQIVRSRKGVGKSALLRKTYYNVYNDENNIAIYLKGSDLMALQEIVADSPHQLVYGWQQRICSRITLEIGTRLNLSIDDDSITLVESAELAGFRGRNIVGTLVDRLKLKLNKIEIQLSKVLTENSQQLLKRYASKKNIRVWLFVDDIDATFLNREDQRLLISTFFSACRNLVNDVDGLIIRTAIRSDVWSVIEKDEATDKCEQYIIDLSWSTKETGDILKKKILAYFSKKYPKNMYYKKLNIDDDDGIPVYNLVFKTPFPWGKKHLTPDKPIHILSAGRPRWAAQLCKLAAKHAVSKGYNVIRITDISRVMDVYGRSRLSDLYKEHSHQCDLLVDIIESFAGSTPRYTTQELFKHITNKIIRRYGVVRIDGLDKGSDSIRIAHYLFRIGFIYGRDEADKTGLSFVKYDERPHLLITTTNLDDNLSWEVHPSYRTILKIK